MTARSVALFVLAAVCEIGGAWLVWQGVREHRGWLFVGAGVVAANTYNDGAAFVDFQDYDSPDQAVAAALKK